MVSEETMLHNGPPHNSNLGYSMAKRSFASDALEVG